MAIPTVDFCGLRVSRLIIGANPFGGYSHQNPRRDEEMRTWHTPDRILETWDRAWSAGINTFIANNETPHVFNTLRGYLKDGGPLQWIAQLNPRPYPSMEAAIDDAIEIGAKAGFVHGAYTDRLFAQGDAETMERWIGHAKAAGFPIGVAGHSPA